MGAVRAGGTEGGVRTSRVVSGPRREATGLRARPGLRTAASWRCPCLAAGCTLVPSHTPPTLSFRCPRLGRQCLGDLHRNSPPCGWAPLSSWPTPPGGGLGHSAVTVPAPLPFPSRGHLHSEVPRSQSGGPHTSRRPEAEILAELPSKARGPGGAEGAVGGARSLGFQRSHHQWGPGGDPVGSLRCS